MKVTFEETLTRKEWLHKELMNSLTGEVITKASKDQFYDVKLLVNGIELEPVFFNKIMNNLESFIEGEAQELFKQKYEQKYDAIERKLNFLNELLKETNEKFKDEMGLDIECDED
jgi:hypothetical protein